MITKFQKGTLWTTLAIAAGVLACESRRVNGLAEHVQVLQRRTEPWIQQARKLEQERDEATNRVMVLSRELTALQADSAELQKLRVAAPRLKEVAQKVARFEAAGGSVGRLESMLFRANHPPASSHPGSLQQVYLDFFTRFRSIARLNADQEQIVRDVLLKQADIQSQIMREESDGTLTPERKAQLIQMSTNMNSQIDAVIPIERRAAVKEAIEAAMERDKEVSARMGADGELMMLQSCIGTTSDQEKQLFPILYGLALKNRSGNPTPPSEKADAVAKVLTPTQLETFRKLIEENVIQTMLQTGAK